MTEVEIPGPKALAISAVCERFANDEVDAVEFVERLTALELEEHLITFALMASVIARDERREATS